MSSIIKSIKYNTLYNDFIVGKFDEFPNPLSPGWEKISSQLSPQSDIQHKAKQILKNQNSDLKSEKGKSYLQMLDDPASEIIITGQQLGLFLSPAYTIYKAITVINQVEKLNQEAKNQKKYIPVFWLESEDHDFPEINHLGVWDSGMQPQTITYSGHDYQKKSIRHYHITEEISLLFDDLSEQLIETEFTSNLISLLKSIYAPGANWLKATRTFFKHLFHDHGLLFFEPGDPEIKTLSVPFFNQMLKNTKNISNMFLNKSQELATNGYSNQVTALSERTFVHLEDSQQNRVHLKYKEENYYSDTEKINLPVLQIEDFVNRNCQKISTTVISRPVLQSWLLPVAAYVGGPAEIAYWCQLSPLFAEFNLTAPVLFPRKSTTLIEPKIQRFIDKLQLDISDIPQKENDFLNSYFSANQSDGDDPFSKLRESMVKGGAEISNYLKSVDPTLIQSSEKLFEKLSGQIEILANKTLQARQRKEQTITNQLTQIHQAVFPAGVLQERFISIVYFLNKYGPDFVSQLVGKINWEDFQHHTISIGKE